MNDQPTPTHPVTIRSRPILVGRASRTCWEVIEHGRRVDGALFTSEAAAHASLTDDQRARLVTD